MILLNDKKEKVIIIIIKTYSFLLPFRLKIIATLDATTVSIITIFHHPLVIMKIIK